MGDSAPSQALLRPQHQHVHAGHSAVSAPLRSVVSKPIARMRLTKWQSGSLAGNLRWHRSFFADGCRGASPPVGMLAKGFCFDSFFPSVTDVRGQRSYQVLRWHFLISPADVESHTVSDGLFA